MKTVFDVRKSWETKVEALDFLVLLLFVLQITREEYYQKKEWLLTEEQVKKLEALLRRRAEHEPIAYIIGQKEFFGRDFFVTKDTLIPRPDSECLIENMLQVLQEETLLPSALLDIGTGSGALALTLASETKSLSLPVYASDTSEEALSVAKKNNEKFKASVTFFHGSLLDPYPENIFEKKVYIIANLPYVSEKIYKKTSPDVQNYEPITALISEEEGLWHYQKLLKEIKEKNIFGNVWLEISPEQTKVLTEYTKNLFPNASLFIGKDLSQKNRFLRVIL